MDFIHRLLGAVVVIAANAGGAWTPIGDVTTTMLWIHGQISTLPTMKVLLSSEGDIPFVHFYFLFIKCMICIYLVTI